MSQFKTNPERYLDRPTIDRIRKIADYHTAVGGVDHDNILTYAIGDIHGMDKYLLKMLEFMTRCAKESPEIRNLPSRFVFLGDYVDRGTGIAESLAMVRLLQEMMPAGQVVALRGNHEELLLADYVDDSDGPSFFREESSNGRSFTRCGQGLEIPADLISWLARLPYKFETKAQVFVHAGLDPRFKIHQQNKATMIWIRGEFLESDHDFGKRVVHGHTPSLNGVEHEAFRTNLDTGACFGGPLSGALFDPNTNNPLSFYLVTENVKRKLQLRGGDKYIIEIDEKKEIK